MASQTSREFALMYDDTELLEDEQSKKIQKNYFIHCDGVLKVNPGGWIYPGRYLETAHHMYDFDYSDKDILIMSFPKSGTTWTQEICWNLLYNPDQSNPHSELELDFRCPDLTIAVGMSVTGAPDSVSLDQYFSLFDKVFPGCRKERDYKDHLSGLYGVNGDLPAPRVFKHHQPLPLMPSNLLEKSKVIYVARNLYDTVNSLYHFVRLNVMWGFTGTMDDLIDDFVAEKLIFSPYFKHMKEAWDRRHHGNLLFLFYEDLKEDPMREIQKIDQFLGTQRTYEQIKEVAEFTSFSKLKERFKDNPPSSNNLKCFDKEIMEKEGGTFFRKGEVGDWKNYITETQRKKLEAYEKENLHLFGNDFKYNQTYRQ